MITKNDIKQYVIGVILGLIIFIPYNAHANEYLWLKNTVIKRSIVNKIKPPKGYERTKLHEESFAYWLRHLPIKKIGTPVLFYNGVKKQNQNLHYAVIDIDTGTSDLQQCADAVIRLKSEYLYSQNKFEDIAFNFTSGHKVSFKKWVKGERPIVKGNKVLWQKKAINDSSYLNFKKYLSTIFMYAGSYSLSKELIKRKNITNILIGDVFIQGGFPGHAVIVVDIAQNKITGKKVFLIAQSYMPAQDIHILKNLQDSTLSPWYSLPNDIKFETPEWIFKTKDLKHF